MTSLTSTNPTGSATGDIRFDQSGGGTVAFGTVTTNDGAIALSNTGAGVTGPIRASGTGKNINLTTTGTGDINLTGTTTAAEDQISIDSAGAIGGTGLISAATITLNAGKAIGGPAKLLNTDASRLVAGEKKAGKLDATSTSGGIFIHEADDLALGRIDAGTGAINLIAGGAITDHDATAAGEGPGNENLVGGTLVLTAGTGIGAPGEGADVDTAVTHIEARTTRSGGVYLAETDGVTVGSGTGIEAAAGADIEITTGSELVVATAGVRTSKDGDIRLFSGNDLAVGGLVKTGAGDLRLSANGDIRQLEGGRLHTTTDNAGTLALRSGGSIGAASAPMRIDVGTVAARADGGGVFLIQVDGIQDNLVIGTASGITGIRARNGDIEVITKGFGTPEDYGRLDVFAPVRVVGAGNILLCAEASESDLVIDDVVRTDRGVVRLKAGRRVVSDFDLSGFLVRDRTTELQENVDATVQFIDDLIEAYAIPDYGVEDLVYLSGANEAIWGESREPYTSEFSIIDGPRNIGLPGGPLPQLP
ncbi:MAG: hypothetical protein LGR52_04850 [Candidatus Thiosymbion ectosymbiont of Robbea hypermnestra]|nr:hypothetical protein [Candidatus Thiosymbion ectosymbiont of Robbea hypermnestra]